MYHLKISMPGFRQVSVNKPDKVEGSEQVTTTSSAKGHFVYTIEVGFLGEYGQSIERQERMASFYHIERRYSAFLQLHNEVRSLGFYSTHCYLGQRLSLFILVIFIHTPIRKNKQEIH